MTVVLGNSAHDADRFMITLAEQVQVRESVHEIAEYMESNPDEDLVVVGPDVPLAAAVELGEKFRLDRPSVGIVLIRRRLEMQAMAEAMRSGVRDVVAIDDAEALQQACARSRQLSKDIRRTGTREAHEHKARVIMVFGTKGGCGRTTIATNLAEALVSDGHSRVCLVDLNLHSGDIGICLQVDPVKTITDALGMQGGLDAQGVESVVTRYKDRFDLLLAPTQPADAEFIGAPLVHDFLTILGELYDYVVIDAPSTFSDVALTCLDSADTYVLVGTLDVLSLKNMRICLDTLDALGYPRSRWTVVLNRCDARVGLAVEDFEEILGVHIDVRLPSSREVPLSVNRGRSLYSANSRHPFSRSIGELARHVAGATRPEPKRGRRLRVAS